MLAALALLAASAAPAACTPIEGAEKLWVSREIRWIFFGELHGTNEIPDAFANLVCLAAATRGPVTVALEFPTDMQASLDAWLASDGGDAARTTLLAAPWWHRPLQDGRSSAAFLHMLERLRALHASGKVASVRAFDVPPTWRGQTDRNADMAKTLTSIATETQGLVLILVGNIHAMRSDLQFDTTLIHPAASLLPDANRISVDIRGIGGSAWNCGPDGCKARSMGISGSGPASLTWSSAPDRKFDVVYALGEPLTAAEPALPGVADTKPLASAIIKP